MKDNLIKTYIFVIIGFLAVARNTLFFGFPCALFGIDYEEKNWRKKGVRDLIHLSKNVKKYETSRAHISNQMKFVLFGKVNIQAELDFTYWINIQTHNEEVTNSRYALSKFIDCIKFCGAFELALGGHDENELSENACNFRVW